MIDKQEIDADQLELAAQLMNEGYAFADRTLQAAIPLKQSADFEQYCRIPLEEMTAVDARVPETALESFDLDSRFFSTFPPEPNRRAELIRQYVEEMKTHYVCRFKGKVIGFIEPVDAVEGKIAEIRFAAVDAKYRRTGAAMSLYAGVSAKYRERGYQKVIGRISARNMSVMNVYAALGATFSAPKDIYLRVIQC